jgi:hypothetical protein
MWFISTVLTSYLVTLGYQGGVGPTIDHSVVAGVEGTEFYLGLLGVNPRPTNFTNLNNPQPSFMTLLKNQSHIPSLSYSYTAGAPYRLNKALGSLILGGYDTSRFQETSSSYRFNSDQSRDLTVGLADIITNVTGSETSLLPSGSISIFIDSSVAEIYLPDDACRSFETAFHLTYDSTVGLYLVNNTLHEELLSKNPSVTFNINTAITGGPGFNVTLPYAAFDLTAEYPLVDSSSLYFPLQRAENDTQYTLGRTFLQEAYIIVDYERYNFSVHPNTWNASAVSDIITILPVTLSSPSASPTISLVSQSESSELSKGATAEIAAGVVVPSIIIVVVVFVIIIQRKKKVKEQRQLQAEISEFVPPKSGARELDGGLKVVSEVEGTEQGTEFGERSGPKVGELRQSSVYAEMFSRPPELGGNTLYEMAGSEVAELPTTEMSQRSYVMNEALQNEPEGTGTLTESPESFNKTTQNVTEGSKDDATEKPEDADKHA